MPGHRRWLVVPLALWGLVACAKPSGPPTAAEGKAYFQALNCATCHRVGDRGGTSGPDLTLVGFRRNPAWLDLWLKDPRAWQKTALMPNFMLSTRVREALVTYLSALKGQDFGAAPPWADTALGDSVARGRIVYQRAGCVACHGTGGRGGLPNNNVPGGLIPSLEKASQGYSLEEIVRKISFGVTPQKLDPAGPEPLVSMPAWRTELSSSAIQDVARYVLSLAPKEKPGSQDAF